MTEPVEVIRSPLLEPLPHGFLGRRGGVSTGVTGGLNVGLGSGDDPEAVRENRRRAVAAVLPGAALVTLHQIHSQRAIAVGEPWPDDDRPRGDALVTDRPGLLLGALAADCVPVLLADKEGGIVAAAHAGWKGALAGIIDQAIISMEALGAERGRIVAATGPAIQPASYEVDEPFRTRCQREDSESAPFFSSGRDADHFQFDLPGYVAERLRRAGIAKVECMRLDTYSEPDRFFSYRRATHRGEPDYGRQVALIGVGP